MTYPRRDPNVLNCTDPYLLSLYLLTELPCDVSGGACNWSGTYGAELYNASMPTYNWSTNVGLITDNTTETCEVIINSDVPVDFELTLTVTCMVDGVMKQHTRTQNFTTSVE